MKNLSDFMAKIETLEGDFKEHEESLKRELFKIYAQLPEISSLFSQVENQENGFYFFDDYGFLCYGVQVPAKIADLKFINDFLTADYFHIDRGHSGHNDLVLSVTCGQAITIDYTWKNTFIHDHEENETIIEKYENWMTPEYIAAKIELHQLKTGVFGDVIEIDYYGNYSKHFNTFEALNIKTETTKEKSLQIIEKIEKEQENE
jgi:hypothetical protein